MNTGRQGLVTLCLVIVLAAGVAPVMAAPPSQPSDSAVFQQEFDADSVLMRIAVAENGSARWTVRYRLALETDNETAAFEELQAAIRQNRSTYLTDFKSRIQATVAAAENTTGREMSATGFVVTTSEQPVSESGFVTYTFTWHSFGAVDGSTIRIGDAIAGLYLDSETTLTIEWPVSHEAVRVDPAVDQRSDNAVTWEGRRSFGAEEPVVVVEPAGGELFAWLPWVLGAVILAALGLGGVFIYRRQQGESSTPTEGPAGSGGASASGPETDEGSPEPPSELLSNEERVTQLLEAHGGRMKQQAVVSELEWTEAKTSQVVNGMQEDGDLEVFRIGRENVLKLPEDDEEQ